MPQLQSNQNVLQQVNVQLLHPGNGILSSTKKKWVIKPRNDGGNSNADYWVKEVNLKGYILYIWLQLYDILEKGKLLR